MKKDAMFGCRLIRFAACALMVVLCVGSVWGQSIAPLNPAYKKWHKEQALRLKESSSPAKTKQKRLLQSASGEEAINYGISPDVVDMSYLANINSGLVRDVQGGFPSSYDLRTYGYTTPVKNQNPYGTCWAHATFGSMESYLKKSEGVVLDFSENNLSNLHGFDDFSNKKFNRGGSGNMASAYLLRWDGPVLESEDPYPSIGTSHKVAPARHVQSVRWIAPRTYYLDNDAIKEAVMSYGGVWVGYYHDDNYFRSGVASYYFNGNKSRSINHAVTIVGWNDDYPAGNFATTPPGNGAFIVKNSWGPGWGEEGYFYVSYYDESFAWTTSYVFCNAETIENYGEIYQYDPLGFVNMMGYPNAISAWGAGIFTARASASLAAVGFYALVPDTTYTLKVYTGCTAGAPTSGTLAATKQGTVDYAGYVTIPLPNQVAVTSRQKFSVVLKLTTPGHSYPLAYEYAIDGRTSEASANSGETFYSYDGMAWTDFTSQCGSANLCVKVYTSSATMVNPTLSSLAISGVSSIAAGKSADFTCIATYSDGSSKDVTKSASWSITDGHSYATVSPGGTVTVGGTYNEVTATVSATYSEDGIQKVAKWRFYVTASAPPSPSDVVASQGTEPSCIRVNWSAPSGATSFAVYRGTKSGSNNAQFLDTVTVARYNDTSANPGKDYWYFIKAKNSSGTSGFSNGANGWRKLSPPDDVTASDTFLDKVAISWNEVEGATHYRVYRAMSMDGPKSALGGWQTATSFSDTTATPDVTYYYYVVAAVDASGNRPSDYSIVEDGMRASPVRVNGLEINGTASIASGGSATYTAKAKYTDGTSKSVTPTWSLAAGIAYATISGGSVTARTVTENQAVTLAANYSEDGVTAVATKRITITAVVPAAPTGLTLVSQTASGVALRWNSTVGATSYKVYRAIGGGEAFSVGSVATTSFTDSTAVPGVTYTYSVAAVNGAGESARSATASGAVPLAAPSGVTATSDRTEGVLVSWHPVNGATHYRVARATSASGAKTELGSWQAGTSYLDTSATDGATYWYFVRAATDLSGADASGYSAGTTGRRIALVSVSITGQERILSSRTAVYSCTATYSDGSQKTVSPDWAVSPSMVATIDANGKLTAQTVTANASATITASFSDGTARSTTKIVTVVAPVVATAEVRNVNVSTRWPFQSLLDIDYELIVNPASAKAAVSLYGRDEDHGVDMAATTLSGDGANGAYIAAGMHRLTWDIGADYTNFHAKAFSVTMTALPSIVAVPEGVTASTNSASAVALEWTPVEDAVEYEIWRGTESSIGSAEHIVTVGSATYSDTSAAANTTYHYWIRALSEYGTGEFSQAVTGMRVVTVIDFTATYLIVDLSGGVDATAYPVTTMNDPPAGGFNTEEYKTSKLVLRRIPAGTFTMGSPESEYGRDEHAETQHTVTISKPYYMGIFEVTQKQYELVVGERPSHFSNSTCYETRPVEWLTMNTIRGDSVMYNWPTSSDVDPSSFMGRLRMKTGLQTFDLPTEAKWEYACRAGTTTALNNNKDVGWLSASGREDTSMNEVGRYYYNHPSGGQTSTEDSDTSSGTAEVGSYMPNAWGLYDMHGNVEEWCLDWVIDSSSTWDRDYSPDAVTDPVGETSGRHKVMRGGSCFDSAGGCRSAHRYFSEPWRKGYDYGFRLCCPASSEPEMGDVPTFADAVDNATLTFTLGGSSPWFVQSAYSHDGIDAARSGALSGNQTNWLQTTVSGAGTVSFWWFASSEEGYDYLEFLIDGTLKDSLSGTNNVWTHKSFVIGTSGTHTLTWRYRKGRYVDRGLDAGFVDQVVWEALNVVSDQH